MGQPAGSSPQPKRDSCKMTGGRSGRVGSVSWAAAGAGPAVASVRTTTTPGASCHCRANRRGNKPRCWTWAANQVLQANLALVRKSELAAVVEVGHAI